MNFKIMLNGLVVTYVKNSTREKAEKVLKDVRNSSLGWTYPYEAFKIYEF